MLGGCDAVMLGGYDAGMLGRWLTELHQGEADEDQLMQRALQAEPLIDQIEQEITTALPTQVAHQKQPDEPEKKKAKKQEAAGPTET